MKFEEIYERGYSYKESFFYGDMLEDSKLYEFAEGVFLLGKTSEDMELLWGVNNLEDLRSSIEKIKKENPDIKFIFRYGNSLNEVIEKEKIINQWGYKGKEIYVGYSCTLDNITCQEDSSSIEYLKREDINEFLIFDRYLFDSLNITKNQLTTRLDDDHHIILVYKKNKKIIGSIIIELYGRNNMNCFIRNVGVSEVERGKGFGKRLILSGLKEAKKKGALKAMLWVGYDNIIARNLYEKIGFVLDESEAEVIFQV